MRYSNLIGIIAADLDGCIGKDGKLPWKIRQDEKTLDGFFRFYFAFWLLLVVEGAGFSLRTERLEVGTNFGRQVVDERGHFVGGFTKEHAVIQAEIHFRTGAIIQRGEPDGSRLVHVAIDGDPSETGVAQVVNDAGRPLKIFATDTGLVFEGLGIDFVNLIDVLKELGEIRRGAHQFINLGQRQVNIYRFMRHVIPLCFVSVG